MCIYIPNNIDPKYIKQVEISKIEMENLSILFSASDKTSKQIQQDFTY